MDKKYPEIEIIQVLDEIEISQIAANYLISDKILSDYLRLKDLLLVRIKKEE